MFAKSISSTYSTITQLVCTRKSNSRRGFHMLYAKYSPKLDAVETDEVGLAIDGLKSKLDAREKAESRITILQLYTEGHGSRP